MTLQLKFDSEHSFAGLKRNVRECAILKWLSV